jgi:hypothetical protein
MRETAAMRTPLAVLIALLALVGAGHARGDALYEVVARTTDLLTRGTVDLEDTVTITVKSDRIRQEVKGARTVLTRRGARYSKPGYRVILDQLDRGVRYEIDLDAGTYTEESFESLRRQQEETIAAAERTFRMSPTGALPVLSVSMERTGEGLEVQGRSCERVVLKAATEVETVPTRGGGPAARAPARFAMTFDVCLAPTVAAMREVRTVEARADALVGVRGPLADRQLRVFAARRDVLAVFELMQRLMERELEHLGGTPLQWERVFVGPRRDQPQTTLYRHRGQVTRIEDRVLDAAGFDLPPGLTLDRGRPAAQEGATN